MVVGEEEEDADCVARRLALVWGLEGLLIPDRMFFSRVLDANAFE